MSCNICYNTRHIIVKNAQNYLKWFDFRRNFQLWLNLFGPGEREA